MKTLNNNIQESYVSFDTAKLLKEKGFDRGQKDKSFLNEEIEITCALAIEWIRVNFGLIIHFTLYEDKIHKQWFYYPKVEGTKFWHSSNHLFSPQEATESALLYTLQNLLSHL